MTGVLTYILTFDALPELDRQGRPKMFYGQRLHDKCYRRAFFDAGQFVEAWDDEGARKGWCLYKMGCRGPTTYNSCSTFKWNCGQGWPVNSGHPCIGCAEEEFLGQRTVLSTPVQCGCAGNRSHAGQDRQDAGGAIRRRYRGSPHFDGDAPAVQQTQDARAGRARLRRAERQGVSHVHTRSSRSSNSY